MTPISDTQARPSPGADMQGTGRILRLPAGWRRLVANLGQLVARNLLQLAIGIGASAIVADSLTRADYGAFQYVLSVASTFSILSVPGLNTVLTQEVAKGNDGVIRSVTRTRLAWAWLMSLPLAATAVYYLTADQQLAIAASLAIAALAAPAVNAVDVTNFLIAKRDYNRLSVYPLTGQFCVAAATIGVSLYWHNFVIVVAATYVVQTVYALVSYRLILRAHSPGIGSLTPEAKRFGLRLTWASLIPSVAYRVDMLLVGASLGLETLAVLALARLFYDKMRIVVDPITSLFVPKLYARSGVEAYRFAVRAMGLIMLALVCVAVLLAVVMPVFFGLLYPKYMDSVPYAVALVFAYVTGVPNALFQCMIQYERRVGQVVRVVSWSHAIYLVSLPFLVMTLGVTGVVIGRYVLNVSSSILSGYYFFNNWRQIALRARTQ